PPCPPSVSVPSVVALLAALPVELSADLEEASLQDLRRLLPRHNARRRHGEVVVIRQDRVRVEQVVEVEVDRRPRGAEPENFRDAEVDLFERGAEEFTGLDQVDRLVLCTTGKVTAKRLLDLRVWRGPIRGDKGGRRRNLLDGPGKGDVYSRNRVRGRAFDRREPVRVDMTVREVHQRGSARDRRHRG